jgi:PqqD family protein of HPr-rel-A system
VRYAINRTQVDFRVLDDGAVIVHHESGHFYTLNATGTFLWERMSERSMTMEELTAELAREFGQDAATVVADVRQLLDELLREHLIVAVK